ncbi:branched-chain amino acid ABC transporter permease/ATP-binding protein [Streptomyces sp. NPDC051976]|uniref:branched-chain amino acid ABC transporter permease/ATP-binding protein n=1 Tax=Streptomyces sp. NPDC051976 TaxID=3154947 RepID=UPI003418B911
MEWVLFAVLGLSAGVAYGGLGIAVVATHRGTGVVNLAQGAVAVWGAYVYAAMRDTGTVHLPVVGIPFAIATGGPASPLVAIVAGVLSSVLVSLLAYVLVFRPLRNAPQLASVVASIGITTVIESIVALQFGTNQTIVPSFFTTGTIRLAGQAVPTNRFEALALFVAITVAVWAYLRFTRVGIAMAAYAENARAITLMGYSPTRLAIRAWTLSGLIAGFVGVMVASLTPLNPVTMTLYIVPALAASLLARFRSVIVVAIAGGALGVLQSIVTFLKTEAWFPTWLQIGAEDLLPLLLILAVLVVGRGSVTGRAAAIAGRLPAVNRPRSVRGPVLAVIVATGLCLMFFNGSYRFAFAQSLIAALLTLSVVVLTGYAGQISVAQLAIAGTAGLLVARLAIDGGLPFPVAAGAAILLATMLGTLTALPALRVVGIQLTVVTLSLAVAVQSALFANPSLSPADLGNVPAPSLFGVDMSVRAGSNVARAQWVILCCGVLIGAMFLVARVMGGRTGVRLLAIRSNERAAASIGVGVVETKAVVFALSSALAASAGVLMTYGLGQFSSSSFDVLSVGLPLLAFAYLGGITSIYGALVGALMVPGGVVYVLLTAWFDDPGSWYLLVSGCALVATAISYPDGIAGTVSRLLPPRREKSHQTVATTEPDDGIATPSDVQRTGPGAGFKVRGVTVRYGGVHAVTDVDIEVAPGEIVGLIGPNGAGKTSLIDGVLGFTPCSGEVTIDGHVVSRSAPHRIARSGLVRTWQNPDLFADLTVAENMDVARLPGHPLRTLLEDVFGRRRPMLLSAGVLDRLDMGDRLGAEPSSLSLGQQKLLGVARSLVSRPTVVLLDEPAAGLDSAESLRLGSHLRALADDGLGILLIDHDMDLVFGTCDRVIVLQFGRVIASGAPAEVRQSPAVVAAYLGSESAPDPVPSFEAGPHPSAGGER